MVEQRFADIAAVRFQYAVAGEDPPVVLLPGSGSWRLTFDDMITERVSRLALLAPAGLDVADVWESGCCAYRWSVSSRHGTPRWHRCGTW